MNTTAEPDPFPVWLGFPTFARLSVACHHDRLQRDTALSVERSKGFGIGLETAARLPASKGAYWRMQYKVEPGNCLPLRANIPKPLTITVAFVLDRKLTFLICK